MMWVRERVGLFIDEGQLILSHTWFNRSISDTPSEWVMVVGFHRVDTEDWEFICQFSKFTPVGLPGQVRQAGLFGSMEYEKALDESSDRPNGS